MLIGLSLLGKKRHPIKLVYSMPKMLSIIPIGKKSNILKGSLMVSARTDDTMILGEEPTKVVIPPSSVANASGIKISDGEWCRFFASFIETGITMLTLFINEDANAVKTDKGKIRLVGFFPNQFKCLESASNRPQYCIPLLIIITATTVTTAGLEKPLKAVLTGIIPAITMVNNAAKATKS